MTDTPWWAMLPCECRQRPLNDPDWWGRYWFCDCGTRWRLMPNGNKYDWVKSPR